MSEEGKREGVLHYLGDIATSAVFKWIELSFEIGEKVKKWVDKLLDGRTYLKPKSPDEKFFKVDNYVAAIEQVKKNNIEISNITRRKLINYVDFFWDLLNEWVLEELNNLINWNPDINLDKLIACMEIDSDDNKDIYKYLTPILKEIKIS